MGAPATDANAIEDVDVTELAASLLRDLRSSSAGLSSREAQRRLTQFGPNQLRRRGGAHWPRELMRQLTHPLALLLWLAAGLSLAVGNQTVAAAVLLVIVLNAAFAFVQELQAERAVEALARYLPQRVRVMRDGVPLSIDAVGLVPGDIVLLAEGERIAADMRLLAGAVEVDLSTLTGESSTVPRTAELVDHGVPRLQARELVFSGTTCVGGEARAVVFATGMHTELGRIASLSERVKEQTSPLERQVRSVAWLIAAVAVAMALAFVPLAAFGAGLTLRNSVVFAVGLLAGNVPEGLLPVITLALAVAVAALARRGALVKRLSAVETLGSTDVICTDKTGTLTQNRMQPVAIWTLAARVELADPGQPPASDGDRVGNPAEAKHGPLAALVETALACSNAQLDASEDAGGDPTEVAVLLAARGLGGEVDPAGRERTRVHEYSFDPQLRLMSTLDAVEQGRRLHVKGAPESVLPRCTEVLAADRRRPLTADDRISIEAQVDAFAADGMRVLALARRSLAGGEAPPARDEAERELTFLGLITMIDPPRPEVAGAVARCHSAGIRIIVVTGDHPLTASAIATRVGIGGTGVRTIDASRLDHTRERELEGVLASGEEVIFSRASPEAKLHIAEVLRQSGHVVAMTGDGVNDAPALREADIGVAMGRSGTDVAREAATMVLTDDNFATIVVAVEEGRRVYDNVRKFIQYIFAHATPEVVPFMTFALSGGAVPLPLTVLQLLAFDVGSETLPSLALGREPAEPGIMERPPRPRSEGVIRAPMLVRAWLFLGLLVAALQMGGFFLVLVHAGWHAGASVAPGHPLHHAYLQATTMSLLGMLAGQIGTAFAVRTQHASLREVGPFSNRYLLGAIAGELALAALFVYAPPLQSLLGTAAPPPVDLALLAAYPLIVWGADELRRWIVRRRAGQGGAMQLRAGLAQ